jgi:uncharacterized protein YndB with AHSA1/START domain
MEIVERHVTLPTDLNEAWELLTDRDELAAWLGEEVAVDPTPGAVGLVVDDDGTRRHLLVEEVATGHRIAWRWWEDGSDPGTSSSRVEITLSPDDGGTRVRVVERPLQPTAPTAQASAAAAWDRRLVELELLVLLAAAAAGVR